MKSSRVKLLQPKRQRFFAGNLALLKHGLKQLLKLFLGSFGTPGKVSFLSRYFLLIETRGRFEVPWFIREVPGKRLVVAQGNIQWVVVKGALRDFKGVKQPGFLAAGDEVKTARRVIKQGAHAPVVHLRRVWVIKALEEDFVEKLVGDVVVDGGTEFFKLAALERVDG